MYGLFIGLILLCAVLLVIVVLLQRSKGGGLAAGFESMNQVGGAPRTADFLEKATWILAGTMLVLCILAVGVRKNAAGIGDDGITSGQAATEQAAEQAQTSAPAGVEENAPEAPAQK